MGSELVVYQDPTDEATRWGADPRAAMIAAHKARRARWAFQAEESARQRKAQAAEQAAREAEGAAKAKELLRLTREANNMQVRLAAISGAQTPQTRLTARDVISVIAVAYDQSYDSVFRRQPNNDMRDVAMYEVSLILNWDGRRVSRFFGTDWHKTQTAIARVKYARIETPEFNDWMNYLEDKIDEVRRGAVSEESLAPAG